MNMKQYKIEDMMKLASELAKRTFIRDEVNVEWTYTSLEDPICGRRRFARIVWRKLNELVHRVNRDLETENLSWDSVAVTVQGWHSDKVHVKNVRAWMQMWFGNNLYLLTQKEGKLYITSSDMGTFPVKMPLDRLREMLTAFDAYLATDIHSVVTSALTACHAQVKANELLTTAALSLIHDLLQGKDLKIAMRQHRDRMYCEVKESEWWGTKRTFRTSLETFREDFAVACIRAGMSINLRSRNMELLQTAAIKRPVYEIFGKASFLDDVDICPVLRGLKPTLDSLRFDGDLEKMFDLKSKRWNFHHISLLQSKGFARMRIVHTPALLYLLSFTSVSPTNSLVIPIEGEPVKFTAVRFEVDEAIAGYDRNEEPRYTHICVKLTSEDKKVILLLDSLFTEYLESGMEKGIDEYVFGKYYKKLASTLQRLGLEFTDGKLKAVRGGTRVYAAGLNQLLVNAVGASNHFVDQTGTKVYMGSILYRFPEHMDCGKMDSYVKAHEMFARGLNALPSVKGVRVIETPFVYQDLFGGLNADSLPQRVREFYGI